LDPEVCADLHDEVDYSA
jgi:hypothetical protein